ncbi:MAG: trypsin-like peptidase domain-containing protein [Mesorhizobium sp.]|nr:trypsin-like peptidase domain-containing protein [Mesorhizobium sp.]MBL8580430.1 trypsin-like peptidase domain-containing protein [Mesorhizobium sp.]
MTVDSQLSAEADDMKCVRSDFTLAGKKARPTAALVTALQVAILVTVADPGPWASEAFATEHPRAYSYADALEPALVSVTRVAAYSTPDGSGRPDTTGSGVVIDAGRGLILTNAHVVSDSDSFRIQLQDRRWLDAELAGVDVPTDVALLRVDNTSLRQIEVADSDKSRVGDVVFAAGYPLGLEQSLSMGIVSGLGRSGGGSELPDFIQTDAAINAGNSGGPLLDTQGRLVGINTAILSPSGGNIGIAFSIPSRVAMEIAAQLAEFGEVRRGEIGVVLGNVTEKDSAVAGTTNWDGALIVAVSPGSPAAAAGLWPGDVVTAFNARHVRSPEGLRTWIGISRIGTPLDLTYMRSGTKSTVSVTVRPIEQPTVEGLKELGVTVRPALIEDGLPDGVTGVVVTEVVAGSPGELAGLQNGDVIMSINDVLVASPQVCDRLVNEAHGRVRVIIYRSGVVRPLIIASS